MLAAAAILSARPAAAVPVDLELVLAVDCSGSVDADEFELQIGGYVAAFTHPSVIRAIRSGSIGAIAVTYVQWSGPFLQNQAVGWTLIRDEESAAQMATAIRAAQRTIFGGGTSLSGIIDQARTLFGRGYEGTRRVIDISGDGINNAGRLPDAARDDAVRAGVTINGLAILTDVPLLDRYFQERVIGGPGAFVIPAASFENFAAAILNKLIREIAEVSAID
jgi:hypothetical protein